FIAVCKHSDPETNDPGIKPPNEVPENRVGFSDVVVDSDGVLRRHLWSLNANRNSPCPTEVAFSLQLALHYLAAQGIEPKAIPEKRSLQLGNILLKPLENNFGGYRNLDDRGYQM
ncbi:MAG TPA: Chase2 sensor protein, partial [Cyanobacteria bacterium UBA8553]|nr:Chase2 sensor protein [Cyanobacteria bacterium UBA8553]